MVGSRGASQCHKAAHMSHLRLQSSQIASDSLAQCPPVCPPSKGSLLSSQVQSALPGFPLISPLPLACAHQHVLTGTTTARVFSSACPWLLSSGRRRGPRGLEAHVHAHAGLPAAPPTGCGLCYSPSSGTLQAHFSLPAPPALQQLFRCNLTTCPCLS